MKKETIVSVLFVAGLIPAYPGRCAESEAPWKAAGEHFSIDTIQPQFGWATDAKTDVARWKPLAQPDMDKQLGDAPELRLVDVAPPPERYWVGHRPYLVPNPDGSSWDMVYPYYNTYRGEQECVIHDFGTGKTRKQYLSGRTGDSVLTRERIDFHMQPSFFAAGKLVFEMYGPVVFVVYDPAEDAFVQGVKPFGDDVINGRCVLGEDGLIYGMGWTKDTSGFVAYRFDPKTYEAKRFEAFGPPNENRRELYRQVVMYGDWIYAAIGAQPWHLVAFNFRTGEGRLLAATEPILGDPSTIGISRMKGGLSDYIRSPASIAEIESFDREEFKFWLHEGEISPRVDDIPPWSESPAETQPGARHVWAREFQVWPRDFVPPSPPPIIPADAGSPDTQGRVELPYRLGDQQEASTTSLAIWD